MKNKYLWYFIASVIYFLLTIGYAVIIFVDFYFGYTPNYLIVLHIMAAIMFLVAAIVNYKRFRNYD